MDSQPNKSKDSTETVPLLKSIHGIGGCLVVVRRADFLKESSSAQARESLIRTTSILRIDDIIDATSLPNPKQNYMRWMSLDITKNKAGNCDYTVRKVNNVPDLDQAIQEQEAPIKEKRKSIVLRGNCYFDSYSGGSF